jgi:hypothetical protein
MLGRRIPQFWYIKRLKIIGTGFEKYTITQLLKYESVLYINISAPGLVLHQLRCYRNKPTAWDRILGGNFNGSRNVFDFFYS